jgi:hypothetical protein
MKKLVLTVCLTGILSLCVAAAALAQAGHEEHHPQAAGEPAAAPRPMGMTGMGGMPCAPGMTGGGMPGMGMGQMGMKGGMGGMMCPMCAQMMGGGMMGEMEGMEEMPGMTGGMRPMGMMGRMGMADRPFFLDRVKELGLSDEQVRKLKEIRQAARVDSIRAAAELRIARLELRELLAGEWKLETAEKLVRNVQKMQGDMKVRFLKAKKEAEKVLTPEQLKMAQGGEEELEGLFR